MPATNTPTSCQTVSGIYIEPMSPDPQDINLNDIAHCLALANRWSGNTQYLSDDQKLGCFKGDPFPYSVAQHSCHVHDIVVRKFGPRPAHYALFHDASEAYLCDIPRPIKPELTNYYNVEANLMDAILPKFNVALDEEIKKQVVEIDNAMIFWERDAIVGQPVAPYANEHQHPGESIYYHIPNFCSWSPRRAKAEFIMRAKYHSSLKLGMTTLAHERHLLNLTLDNIGVTCLHSGLSHLDMQRVA